jgi:hypothetical protein
MYILDRNYVKEWKKRANKDQLQVLQVVFVQEEQLSDVELIRLLPPPIPKEENCLQISLLLHSGQETESSPPRETSTSKRVQHF